MKKNFSKNIVTPLIICFLTGCGSSIISGTKHTHPSEMYAWSPPSEKELALRRERQRDLDDISFDIEQRYIFNEDLKNEEAALVASLMGTQQRLASLTPAVQKEVDKFREEFQQFQTELASLDVSTKEMDSTVKEIQKPKVQKRLTADLYVSAMRLFKEGKYKKSIDHFRKMLKQKPPKFLQDNIYFGMGTAYYKLKNWKLAAEQYDMVIQKYPVGDKWPASSVMLAMIHNMQNEKSKAVYVLQNALDGYLSDPMRELMMKLMDLVQQEAADVSS